MPKTPTKSKSASHRAAPYSSPGSDTDLDDQTPNTGKSSAGANGRGKGTAWTADELKAMFRFAINRGNRSWDEAIPGRTGSQTYQTWSKRVVPYIDKCLEERAKSGKA